jgi:hypothetical protein
MTYKTYNFIINKINIIKVNMYHNKLTKLQKNLQKHLQKKVIIYTKLTKFDSFYKSIFIKMNIFKK